MNVSLPAALQIELFKIAGAMEGAGLPAPFIAAAVRAATDFEGIYDLMVMWRDETESTEREHIVADIQDMIDETSQAEQRVAVYVRFNDLEQIAKDIRGFKDGLLKLVNERGGITKLSRATGIPQPSLSRFFNTASMPRRGTLLKIANALDLNAVQIATEWVRD